MDAYRFDDVLTGSTVSCEYPGLEALMVQGEGQPARCASLFFPGCSLLNYGLPLVKAVQDLLQDAREVEGLSLLCCGKILSYEPDGDAVRAAFEDQLIERVSVCGVERIVAACPNCVKALRGAFERDERTAGIMVEPLPAVLARMGYRIKTGETLCPHDSCPDRDTGEFADGLRVLLPEEAIAEPAHNRKRSLCCGSLVRAKGKYEAADKQARGRADEAREAGADALVTACMSCTFQLSAAQREIPVYHYLELLFNWRVPWPYLDGYMKLRFLFDESLGVHEEGASARAFVGLDAANEVS